ncbi:hypothetical protein M0804_012862 [Polistes exclamans]|nr:hypothetical protein M0804_012862 [Polistes exclamans]
MIENHKNKFVSIHSTNEHNPKNKVLFNDELWDLEWYLQDTRSSKRHPKLDLNVLPVYELGFTGRGIRIAVLDDGLEYDHGMNAHGTRCAGEIAMEANNGKCGVGVAFEAYIGGIKLLDGLVNDRVEGEALGFKPEIVDIYTASWGPPDDGKSLEAPGRLAEEAIYRGINKGRNGKGSIYVWASGNGGSKYDNCGCDGYVGSIYTIAIGSASQTGRSPWYSEKCPAILATTYSSGTYQDQMIVTTDLRNTCTTKHTGTSASAPLAAGILALALQANKNLTWRDVQHLIVWTSEYGPLNENPGWSKNAAGFWYNLNFGFGLMNAYVLVKFASHWINVPEKKICEIPMEFLLDTKLIHGMIKTLRFVVNDNKCSISDGNEMNFLEHVEIEVNLEYTRRGVLEMYLVAPSGTKVQLLGPRKLDDSSEGFNKWKFMSVASWGEDPHGIWFLHIFDKYGRAPIHWAASKGNTEIIEMLIKTKCDIEAKDKFGMRPLHMAAWYGHEDAVKVLINAGANVFAVNKVANKQFKPKFHQFNNLLLLFLLFNFWFMGKRLIFNVLCTKQYTLLMCGARGNNVNVVKYLAEAVESLNGDATDYTGATALHHAAVAGHPGVISAICNIPKTELNATDQKGQAPIHCACTEEHLEAVKVLIELGAKINAQDNEGNTPLHVATRMRQIEMVQLLLKVGANIDLTDQMGFTPLHLAASHGCKGILELLIQNGAALNKKCKNGNTALHLACQNNEVDTVEILINKGVDINSLNLRLQSSIHIAAEMGHTEICELLLASGANIEQKEKSGRTPLYVAARGSFTAIVDMIIKTARLDYPTPENSDSDKEIRELTPARRRWREDTRGVFMENMNNGNGALTETIRSVLWKLAYKQLGPGDWKKMAQHWAFSHEQIRAIEHQYTGSSSYKEHGFRMLLIWASGLNSETPLVKELCKTLRTINKKSLAAYTVIHSITLIINDHSIKKKSLEAVTAVVVVVVVICELDNNDSSSSSSSSRCSRSRRRRRRRSRSRRRRIKEENVDFSKSEAYCLSLILFSDDRDVGSSSNSSSSSSSSVIVVVIVVVIVIVIVVVIVAVV